MIIKSYQRRHLRAPFREPVLYTDGSFVQKASTVNLSEGGLLINQLPSFPEQDKLSLLLLIPQMPLLKNLSLLKMQTFSKELFKKQVIRVKARMVRRDELSLSLDNIFKAKFGLNFETLGEQDLRIIQEYVGTYSSNLIYLQTLIDSFNSDDEIKLRTRALARILGYQDSEKISDLRTIVSHDYKSLQWL